MADVIPFLTGSAVIRPADAIADPGRPLTVVLADAYRGRFDEAIVSYNVEGAATLVIEARAKGDFGATTWYQLGQWSSDARRAPRRSVEGSKDEFGRVETDTVALKAPADALDVRLTLRSLDPARPARLKLVAVAASLGKPDPEAAQAPAPAGPLEVPLLYQGQYPRGAVICSPTSLSMGLRYWAGRLKRKDLEVEVPDTDGAVFDDVYKGAGNWPFNTAYAGSFPGLESRVGRFRGFEELAAEVRAGRPVMCSVSSQLLGGGPLTSSEQGHLVVFVGFGPKGEVILNNPSFRERKTYDWRTFAKAWAYSRHTVYLMRPEGKE